MDMFKDELIEEQIKTIERLSNQVHEQFSKLRKMNMIYKAAYEITSQVTVDGDLELDEGSQLFRNLLKSLQNYDNDKDLRGNYLDLLSDWM